MISFGRRLRSSVRDADTVARLAGDEFAVLLEYLNGEDEAVLVVDRTLGSLRTPFRIKGRQVPVAISIGISYSDSSADPGELLSNADDAMYRTKKNGKAQYELYRPNPENGIDPPA